MKQIHFFLLLLLTSSFSSLTLSQSTPAASPKAPVAAKPAPATPAPAPMKPLVPSGPQSGDSSDVTNDDIIKILRKAKIFSILIRLLKTTQVITQINSQLIATKAASGLTILAPDDNAFSELKAGFLNSLDDNQKIELLQFHVLPVYVASSNFDSLSNPVRTLAPIQLQLNVIADGNMVNISTGVVNTTMAGIVYTDRSLAIYHLNKVLIPLDFLKPKSSLAPAPSLALAKAPKADDKDNSSADGDDDQSESAKKEKSGAQGFDGGFLVASVGIALVSAALRTSY